MPRNAGSQRAALYIYKDPKCRTKIVELRTVHKLTIACLAERYSVSPRIIKQILTEAANVSRQVSI